MIKPINNKIILEIEENDFTTKSGIIVNSYNNEKQIIGKIIEISEEVKKEGQEIIKIGKKVIFEKFSAIEITYSERKYFVLDVKDILAIIEE